MKQDMTYDMKHNDMKRNNEMRDTVFTTRRHHGYCGGLLRKLLLLMVMIGGAIGAWGQDYSGMWYIGSTGYNASTPANNYYLCPTEGWCYYKSPNDYDADGDTYPNPFLTTFKCQNGVYDARKAVWEIEKASDPNSDYYYIKQKLTGKYLVSNGVISTTTNGQDRMRVHLESIASEDLDDKVLFTITPYPVANPEYLVISPKEIIDGNYYINHDKHNLHKWLTVNNGNTDYLVGRSGKTGGPGTTGDQYQNTAGIVGIYTQDDANAKFYLERPRPIISYNTSNLIEITYPDNTATIYYTTDGSEPPTSGTEHIYGGAFDPSDDVTTIKSIAVVNDIATDVATFTPLVLLGSAHKRLIQSQNNAWNTNDYHFYMIPGDEANSIQKVNTTSLFRPSMEWYFLNAGVDNNVQYYYIVNNANSKYLCYDATNIVYMETFSNDNKFKFSIVESATTGTYNIIPYGLSSGNRFINKNTDNANANAINLNNNGNTNNSRWKFVLPSTLDKTAPFTPSAANTSYYKIKNYGSSDYFIVTPTESEANAKTSNSEDADVVRTMNWFFEEAQEASSEDWCTYYYIRNAVTGDYLYFTKDENNKGACLEMRSAVNNTYKNRYLFTWARTATENTYYIVPKLLKDVEQNRISSLRKHDNNTSILTNVTRAAGNFAWTFPGSTFKCADPVITYDATQGTATITCATPDAKIYYVRYTDDTGADPDLTGDKTGLTLYDGTPIDMSGYSYIKARAARSDDGSDQSSSVSEGPITAFKCATPVIKLSGGDISITCATTVATIYYTVNQEIDTTNPLNTTGILTYSTPFPFDGESVIRAIAIKNEIVSNKSDVATYDRVLHKITRSSAITEMAGNYYFEEGFVDDRSDAIGTDATPFTGTIDGGYHSFSLNHPLIGVAQDATIKNVIISNANINTTGNVGAIVNHAQSTTGSITRIYNCGVLNGSVTGTGAVGGLVGKIVANSSCRVINCYNYATVSGSSHAAGIVGRNDGTIGPTRIALCMMYGDITSGNVISPVYTGTHVDNIKKFTEYNFYRSKADLTYTAYNDQLAIDKDEYLTRFPFYRHILNTHRELAAYFLFAANTTEGSVSDISQDEVSEIGHWVGSSSSYPIVEEWKTNTKKNYTSGNLNVKVIIGTKEYNISLPITNMSPTSYDFTDGKVVLPFANEFEGWTRDWSKVCTGWEITNITGGTTGTFEHYDMANRDCTAKDLYANSNYVFAQGGNYIVPNNVSAITITAHFANAHYLSDPAYEIGYAADFKSSEELGGTVSSTNWYHGQPVHTSLSSLVTNLNVTNNPNDQAIVLVGNFHYMITGASQEVLPTNKAVTIMSADEDCNQEPDYGWYMGDIYGRLELPSLRFDFVPIIEIGMSSRVKGTGTYPGLGIWHTRGWYEQTETCVSFRSQCEINSNKFISNDDTKGNNRWIINSGYFIQVVRSQSGACNKLSYIQIGGNAYVKEFFPGNHTDHSFTNTAVPIIVSGGQVDECYMTGYKAGGKLEGDIYFWCAGGKIGKFLGAYLDEPVKASGADHDPGMTARVDHALIGRFFGGGTSANARIKGDIDVTINNSRVDFYCGGPEFGDMYNDKTVTTHANATTFGEFYGGGFGGTSITYNREWQTQQVNISGQSTTYNVDFKWYTDFRLERSDNVTHNGTGGMTPSSYLGLGTCYKFEYIYHSSGSNAVSRFYTGYAQFSLATTGNVTNILENCTIEKMTPSTSLTKVNTSGDFYGAGCQGMVNGTVTSTLTGCTVQGSAYGGGYKAESNEVEVYTTSQPTYSVYTKETGLFSDFGEGTSQTFTWTQGDDDHSDIAGEGTTLYTNKDINMNDLGNVTGDITITIENGSVAHDVYGGGNESKSLSDTTVNLKGNAEIGNNVFGGGNQALVSGSAKVNIEYDE